MHLIRQLCLIRLFVTNYHITDGSVMVLLFYLKVYFAELGI